MRRSPSPWWRSSPAGRRSSRNIANLRIKETDRLHALETELRKLGAGASTTADTLAIEPGRLHGAEIETYDDHRMAMSFALAGLRIPGVVDPGSRLRAQDVAGVFRDAGAAVGMIRFSATLRPPLRAFRGTH